MADQRNPAEPTSVLQHNTLMPPGDGTSRALPRPDVGVCRLSPPPGIYNLSSGAGRGRSHEPDSYAIQLQSPTLQSIGPPSIKNISQPTLVDPEALLGKYCHVGVIRQVRAP